jgi:hypothetical protein
MKKACIAFMAAALFSAACSGPKPDAVNETSAVASPTQTAGSLSTPSPIPAASPIDETVEEARAEFEGTVGITEKKNPAATRSALLKDVRSAARSNYDRVVFEFDGTQLPAYKIEYIDKPVRACGSGNVVPLRGDAWLSVRFTDANAHTEAGEPTIKDRTRSPNNTIVKDLKLICDFEADVEWVMGVASPNKYRVLELKNPTRLVVDVGH